MTSSKRLTFEAGPLARWTVVAAMLIPATAWAQARESRFGLTDNSFLVEEAYNQDPGIFQNLFLLARQRDGGWGAFTQEWPLGSRRHQASFTLPFAYGAGAASWDDIAVHYRLQVRDAPTGAVIAWRLTALLPTSADRRAMEAPGIGWQTNLPVSYECGPIALHGNAGLTWMKASGDAGGATWEATPSVAGSVIWAARRMVHPMFEVSSEWTRDEGSSRRAAITIAPGIRMGWDIGSNQIVVGAAALIERGATVDRGAMVYFSSELPFVRGR